MEAKDFSIVTKFENEIAAFFGAPFAIAVDSCTHGLELCLRFQKASFFYCPQHTYLSIPMLADKLKITLRWKDGHWKGCYPLHSTQLTGFSFAGYENPVYTIIDAAVLWQRNSYISHSFMCISFQYQKHLSLGRGGMILTDNKEAAIQLKKISYDGRLPNIPWREQNIDTMGYHYYCTPETAALGLEKLPEAIRTKPREWSYSDYPDLTKMELFKNA